jgi:hypothetical protein
MPFAVGAISVDGRTLEPVVTKRELRREAIDAGI